VAWLLGHFQGCVVPSEAVAGAADNGHLQVLNLLWTHDGGQLLAQSEPGNNTVHWDSHSLVSAVHHRRPNVVRWLHEHLPPTSDGELAEAIRAAVEKDAWDLAKFLLPPGRCLLDYAESSSNPRMIEWMLDCGYLARDHNVAVRAIRDLVLSGSSDNLTLIRRIADQHTPPPLAWDDVWTLAMNRSGELQTLQWLVEHPTGARVCEQSRNESSSDIAALALERSPADVAVLQYLYEQGLLIEQAFKDMLLTAISGQPLEVLKWLVDHRPDSQQLPSFCLMDEAAAWGRLDVLQYFQRLQGPAFTRNSFSHGEEAAPLWCSTKAMDQASANGHLEVVKWLHENRREGCTVGAMNGAASRGRPEVVKWLYANRSEGCTEAAMDGAAAFGDLETVKWLHAKPNVGCTTAVMDGAARRGFLDVLKWLHANPKAGCTTDATDGAARGGHLETLEWLHGNTSEGCTVKAINSALGSCHFRVASWLHEHYPECTPTKLIGWSHGDNSFEELLFREEHYGGIFASKFLQRLRDPSRRAAFDDQGDAWSWVKEKYIGT
jgi:hypothetical protein